MFSAGDPYRLNLKIDKLRGKPIYAYFDKKLNIYSSSGMETIESWVYANGSGKVFCSSAHLTKFVIVQAPPHEEIGGVVTESNYDSLSNHKELKNYHPLSNSGIYIYIYIL